jgi:hypothetical protein
MLQATAETVMDESERESWRGVDESKMQSVDHWNQSYLRIKLLYLSFYILMFF